MADLKQRIAKRCAKEFKDGDFVNLGIGLPTMVANYIPDDIVVTLHSENGFAGLAEAAEPGKEDVHHQLRRRLCNSCRQSQLL